MLFVHAKHIVQQYLYLYISWQIECRAACAVMGFVGTWVGQASIGSLGLLRTGVCALLLQAGSLALAAVIYRCAGTSHLHCSHPGGATWDVPHCLVPALLMNRACITCGL